MNHPRYRLPLTPEQLDARKSMPLDPHGHIVSLQCTVDRYVSGYEAKWREWLAGHAKHLWPDWVDSWADVKRQRGLS